MPQSSLLIDVGNQRLKWAVMSSSPDLAGGRGDILTSIDAALSLRGVLCLPDTGLGDTDDSTLSDMLSGTLSELDGRQIQPHRILISSVNDPQTNQCLEQYCIARWQCRPERFCSETLQLGLCNAYEDPSQLGSDRWLAALAGYSWWKALSEKAPLVIIDAGTAVTVDLVSNHCFKGGAILPGLATIIRTLVKGTDNIRVDANKVLKTMARDSAQIIAKNSNDAVKAGAVLAVIGGIDRYLESVRNAQDSAPVVLATGGDAVLVASLSRYPMQVFENLVLSGLALVAMEQAA